MGDDADKRTSFVFSWGSISLEVGGKPELVQQGFDILRSEILPRIDLARGAEGATGLSDEDLLVETGTDSQKPAAEREASSPAEFIKEKQPKTGQKTVAVLAYYAKTYDTQDVVTVPMMQKLVNEAHIKMFNVQNAIWNAARTSVGWLSRVEGKQGQWKLTAAGENLVKTQLPAKTS